MGADHKPVRCLFDGPTLMDLMPAIRLNKLKHDQELAYPKDAMLGYVRGFLGGVLLKILVDSGNLGKNVMSHEMAEAAHLPIHDVDVRYKLQTATGSPIEVIGVVRFPLKIENVNEPLILESLVCKEVEGLNLGNQFLREFDCKLDFKEPAHLEIQGQKTLLRPRNCYLSEPTNDEFFKPIIAKLRNLPASLMFLNLGKLEGGLNMDWHVRDTMIKGGVRPLGKIKLSAGEVTQVPVNVKGIENQRSEALFFMPRNNNSKLNHKQILPLPGIYTNAGGKFMLNVMNLSKKTFILDENQRLGWVNPITSTCQPVNNIKKSEGEDKIDRRKFIFDSLKLGKNTLLSDTEKSEVVDMFVDNYEAVSEREGDLGKTSLLKFNITLKEGAVATPQS